MSTIVQVAFLLFVINFANARQDVPNGKSLECQANGEYCQVHWECCSGKCMTYNYVCAALAAPPTIHIEKPSQTLCQRNWQFCQNDGDCCSTKCIPFYNVCAGGNSYPFPYFNTNSLQQKPIINTSKDQVEIVTLPNESNSKGSNNNNNIGSTTGSIDSKEKATSFYGIFVNKKTTAKPKECHQIGEDCYTSEECCSKRCLFYSHKCVT